MVNVALVWLRVSSCTVTEREVRSSFSSTTSINLLSPKNLGGPTFLRGLDCLQKLVSSSLLDHCSGCIPLVRGNSVLSGLTAGCQIECPCPRQDNRLPHRRAIPSFWPVG